MLSWQLPTSCFTVLFWLLAGACPWSLHRMVPIVVAVQEPCFPAIFVFGDSLSDTGNGVLTGESAYITCRQLPFGETYPGWPAWRYSDGRLIVDFLATYFGLPLLNPSLDTNANFSQGVNYAVAGASALDTSFLYSHGMDPIHLDDSLEMQIQWHLDLKALGTTAEKPSLNAFANGLYVLAVGGNDYFYAMQEGNDYVYDTSAQISSVIVPLVIAKIREAAEELHANGAQHFLFISLTPLGCMPSQLSLFPNGTKDPFGCLQDLNALAYLHNSELRKLVYELRGAYPAAEFLFADYYGAHMLVLASSGIFGFTNTLDACCGGGPEVSHNYNRTSVCNNFTTSTIPKSLCSNPNEYLSWDGIHYTDRFNSIIFDLIFHSGDYLDPSTGLSKCMPEVVNHKSF